MQVYPEAAVKFKGGRWRRWISLRRSRKASRAEEQNRAEQKTRMMESPHGLVAKSLAIFAVRGNVLHVHASLPGACEPRKIQQGAVKIRKNVSLPSKGGPSPSRLTLLCYARELLPVRRENASWLGLGGALGGSFPDCRGPPASLPDFFSLEIFRHR